ncbi:MAG: hypothetical protein J6N72_01615 [Psychrobacter sp.]|nr:hypothetical protein [Psychrobacter sp.]
MTTFSKEMTLFLKSKTLKNTMSSSLMAALIASFNSERLFANVAYNIVHKLNSETLAGLKKSPKMIETYIANKQDFLDFATLIARKANISSNSEYVASVLSLQRKYRNPDVNHVTVRQAIYDAKIDAKGADLEAIIIIYKQALIDLSINYVEYESRKLMSASFTNFIDSLNLEVTPSMAKTLVFYLGGESRFIEMCKAHQKAETINKNGLFADEDAAAIFYNDNFELCEEFIKHNRIKNRRPSDVARLITSSLCRDYLMHKHELANAA